MPLFTGWVLRKSSADAERTHLNKILEEIRLAIAAAASTGSGGGWNYIAEDGDVYMSEDNSDLYIGGDS